jgi:hypothetical protein
MIETTKKSDTIGDTVESKEYIKLREELPDDE